MALTQARAFGAGTGRRYGSFAGRDAGAHPVETITQPTAFGAHTGVRYGSFSGRGGVGRPVARITQLRAFGSHAGARYESFGGKTPGIVEPPAPPTFGGAGVGYYPLPDDLRIALRRRQIDEDDIFLLLASLCVGSSIH